MTPSSCPSKSIVALSVSISASESPTEKDSPSEIFQEAIVPASIVDERADIPITVWSGRSVSVERRRDEYLHDSIGGEWNWIVCKACRREIADIIITNPGPSLLFGKIYH